MKYLIRLLPVKCEPAFETDAQVLLKRLGTLPHSFVFVMESSQHMVCVISGNLEELCVCKLAFLESCSAWVL